MQEFLLIAAIFFASSTVVCSIQCYQCLPPESDNCSSYTSEQCREHQTALLCPKEMNSCMRFHLKGELHGGQDNSERLSCATSGTCTSLKEACEHHNNVSGFQCEWSCCNDRNLCNTGAGGVGYQVAVMVFCSLLIQIFVSK